MFREACWAGAGASHRASSGEVCMFFVIPVNNPVMTFEQSEDVAIAHLVGARAAACSEEWGLCNNRYRFIYSWCCFHLCMRTVYERIRTVNRWSCVLATLSHEYHIKHTCMYTINRKCYSSKLKYIVFIVWPQKYNIMFIQFCLPNLNDNYWHLQLAIVYIIITLLWR